MINDGIENKYDVIPKQIRDTGKKTYPTQKVKGKDKRKKKVQYGHMYLVERVESVARIRRRLEQRLKCK